MGGGGTGLKRGEGNGKKRNQDITRTDTNFL